MVVFMVRSESEHIAIAGVALTGGGDFGPRRIQPNCHVVSAW